MERTVPFRLYLSNLTLWCIGSEKTQQAQVSSIIRRLGGTAREVADLLTPQEMFLGGVVEGIQLEPVAYLIQGLQRKFASLDEEARLRALLNMMRFKRKPGERVDELLARFDVIRTNARIEGQFVMSIEGYAVLLLSSLGITHDNIAQTLAPLRGRLPNSEAQLEEITSYMRRMGHIQEHRPDNIADQLNQKGGAPYHFSDGNQQAFSPETPVCPSCNTGTNPFNTWGSFLGSSASGPPSGVPSEYDVNVDSGTESDTSSDDANTKVDFSDINGLSKNAAAAELFWQMAQAKQRWRRFTNKPVRKARRFAHAGLSLKGYGKGTTGKGKSGKGRARYNVVCEFLTNLPANCPNNSEVLTYFQKGKGKGSSGKGFGRTGNPKDRDGNVMTCSICGSTEHFRANCTQSSSDPPTVGLSQPTAQPSGTPAGRYLNRTLGTEPQGNFQIASRPDPPKRQEDSPFGDLLAGRDEGPTRAANETTYLSNRTDTNLYTSTFMVHEGPLIQEVTTEEERAKIVRETRETLLADMANGYVPPEFGPSLPTANGRATSLGADILPDAWEAAAKANLGKPLYMDTTKVPASWGTLTRSPEAATSSLDAKDKEPVIRSTGIASAFAASTGSPAEPKFPQAQPSCIIEKTLGTLTRAPDGTWNTYSADASKPLFAPTGNAITDNFLAISAHRGKQAVTNFQQQKKEKTARNEVSAFQLAALNRSPVADALVPDDHFWPFGSTKANPSNPQQAQIQAAAPGPYVAYHPAEPPKPLMNIPVSSPDTTYNPLHSWHENRLQQLQAIPLLKRAEAQWKQQLTAEATERAKLLVAAQLAANPAAGPSVVPMAKALVEEPAQHKPLFSDQSELAAAAHRAAAAVLAPAREQFNIATPPRDSGVDTEGIELDLQPPSTSVGCNLCGKSFAVDDDFVRLYCGHPFHTSCWRYRKSQIPRGCRCNVCHGPPDEAARLRWVGIFTHLCAAHLPLRSLLRNQPHPHNTALLHVVGLTGL
jgi:hypothetical protein